MNKIIVMLCAGVFLLSGSQAFAIGEDIAKAAIKEAGETARAAINKNKSEVKVKNSKLFNKVDLQEAVSIGNSGISVKGDKVDISNSTLDSNVKMKTAVSIGNSGIQLGK